MSKTAATEQLIVGVFGGRGNKRRWYAVVQRRRCDVADVQWLSHNLMPESYIRRGGAETTVPSDKHGRVPLASARTEVP